MDFIGNLENNIPFCFVKYGDGEYYAAHGDDVRNCDGTPYSQRLRNGIISSFQYLSECPNVYIGKWEGDEVQQYWTSLVTHEIRWEDFNLLVCRSKDEFLNRGIHYLKAIRDVEKQKLYICNESMIEQSRELLRIDTFIPIHPTNWFETSYEHTLRTATEMVCDPENIVFLTSAGMGAKPLLADLRKAFPKATLIDIGSTLDALCGNRRSRDWHYNFSEGDIQEMRKYLCE
jgi:hypothetical protein